MNTKKFSRAAWLGSVAAATLLSAEHGALAQGSGGIEEVVVVAQKVRQNINDVGMSITALSGDQLSKAGITSPNDLGKAVPGFSYTYSGYGQPVYSLRGVGFYDTVAGAPPAVSVYLNEVSLPFSAMTPGASYDVQRVEVLKGPVGTLYGQNATGGAINFISNKPTSTFQAGADIGYASYDELTIGGFVSGPIGSKLKARISANADEGGAWQKSFTTGGSYGASHFYTGRGILDYQATDDLKFELNINGWVDRSDNLAGQVIAVTNIPGKTPAALVAERAKYPSTPPDARYADWDQGSTVNGNNDTVYGANHNGFRRKNSFMQGSLRADYNFGNDLVLTSLSSWDWLKESFLIDTDGMNFNNFTVASPANFTTYAQEVRLAGKTGKLQWLIGANFEHDRIFNLGETWVGVSSFTFKIAPSNSTENTDTYAAFAHAEYALTKTLSVIGGIRYTQVNITNLACTFDGGNGIFAGAVQKYGIGATHNPSFPRPPVGGCDTLDAVTFKPGFVHGKLDESNVPWQGGVNWKAGPNSLLYFSASRGFKAGTFSPVGAVVSSYLDPAVQEKVMAYEAGFKLGLAQNHLQVNGAVFFYDYTNKQVRGKVPDPVLGSVNKEINIPKSRIHGGEVDITWVPDEHWHFQLGATYADSQIRHFTGYNSLAIKQDMDGNILPYTPKWQGLADAEYDFPVTVNLGAFVGAHANFEGVFYSGLGNLQNFRSHAYTTMDLRVGVQSADGHWMGTFFVNNVADEYSWNAVNLAGPDVIVRIANKPRIFGVRLSFRT